jgi:hypothetical protein
MLISYCVRHACMSRCHYMKLIFLLALETLCGSWFLSRFPNSVFFRDAVISPTRRTNRGNHGKHYFRPLPSTSLGRMALPQVFNPTNIALRVICVRRTLHDKEVVPEETKRACSPHLWISHTRIASDKTLREIRINGFLDFVHRPEF